MANTLSLHLNSVFTECIKPGYCNILVTISKVSNYFNKRMSLNSHDIIFSTVFCIDVRSFKWQFSYL